MNLGNRIAKVRKEKKLTQQELAKKLFVTDKTISSWESNRTEPNLETIMKLSEVLDCSAGYLIYEDITRNDIETEIKIQLVEKEFHRLEFIMEKEGDFLNKNHQVDTYYQPTYRSFIDKEIINEWLRIGKRGSKIILTYKNWYNIHCDEYEVEIDNEENLRKYFKY